MGNSIFLFNKRWEWRGTFLLFVSVCREHREGRVMHLMHILVSPPSQLPNRQDTNMYTSCHSSCPLLPPQLNSCSFFHFLIRKQLLWFNWCCPMVLARGKQLAKHTDSCPFYVKKDCWFLLSSMSSSLPSQYTQLFKLPHEVNICNHSKELQVDYSS
jgi:hypothetical protein